MVTYIINYAIILDQSYAKMFSLYETLIYSETEYNCNNSFSFVPTRTPKIKFLGIDYILFRTVGI